MYPAHVDLSKPCCEYDGPKNAAGYGFDGVRLIHRKVYQDAFGKTHKFVCHACDNPACIELAHLFEGTHQDNVDDMVSKGRHPHGTTHGAAKLTEEQVHLIRAAPPRQGGKLAKQFGVSRNVIFAIRSGRTWKHL